MRISLFAGIIQRKRMIFGMDFSKLDSLVPSCPSDECSVGDCLSYRLPPFDAPRDAGLLSLLPPAPALVFRFDGIESRSLRLRRLLPAPSFASLSSPIYGGSGVLLSFDLPSSKKRFLNKRKFVRKGND